MITESRGVVNNNYIETYRVQSRTRNVSGFTDLHNRQELLMLINLSKKLSAKQW